MLPRQLASKLIEDAKSYPVITLTGPRQSGKSTLARATFPDHAYLNLEDPESRAWALSDPKDILATYRDGLLIDECQRAPDLLSYIQVAVDEDDSPGRFVLTGSQNFLLMRSVSQSLAGRTSIRHLLPLSMDELYEREAWPMDNLGRLPAPGHAPPPEDVFEVVHRGFYPRIHDKDLEAHDWLRSYIQTYLERDVRDLVQVADLESFRRFLALAAGRSGQLLNLTSLGQDAGISHATARRWLGVLETSFIVRLLRPHTRNFNKRLIKAPKLYFLDTGLLTTLLRINDPQDLSSHAARGAIFETFVVAELFKRVEHLSSHHGLSFWRESSGHEIDVVIEGGSWQTALEIKSGRTIARDFFKGLDLWQRLHGDQEAARALVYAGDHSHKRHGAHVHAWYDF